MDLYHESSSKLSHVRGFASFKSVKSFGFDPQFVNYPWLSKDADDTSQTQLSLAVERENQVGTITLPSSKHKDEALKRHNTGWEFDDTFNGITTLYSPACAEIE